MHIPDGWVDLPTSAAAGAVAAGGVAVSARRARTALAARATSLPAVVAAYLLVAQLLVVPVGLGTSAHLVGTGLAALLVGPALAILCVSVVVVLQALVLADGGVTALGLNLVNDGLVPALVAYGAFVLVRPLATTRRARAVAAGACAGAGALAAAGAAALEFVIGGTGAVSPATVAASIGGTHVLVAGLEAALTAVALGTILRLRPDLVRAVPHRRAPDASGAGAGARAGAGGAGLQGAGQPAAPAGVRTPNGGGERIP